MFQLEKMPFRMVFAQYLEIEFRDLRLVLSRWISYMTPSHLYSHTLTTHSTPLLFCPISQIHLCSRSLLSYFLVTYIPTLVQTFISHNTTHTSCFDVTDLLPSGKLWLPLNITNVLLAFPSQSCWILHYNGNIFVAHFVSNCFSALLVLQL